MNRSVFLTITVSLPWLIAANAILKPARVPSDFRPDNGRGKDGNREYDRTGSFVLVAKPPNPYGKNNPKTHIPKNITHGIRLYDDGEEIYKGINRRLGEGNASLYNVPGTLRMHYSPNGRDLDAQYTGEKLPEHAHDRTKPTLKGRETQRTLNSDEDEGNSGQENSLATGTGIQNKRKHKSMLKISKRTRARHYRNVDKITRKMNRPESPTNETAEAKWVEIFQDGKRTNSHRRAVEASQLLRCRDGNPPQINLPVNSQLSLDTKGANLDQNTECSWRLKMVDGQGFMVHCYFDRSEGGHFATPSTLTLTPTADGDGNVRIERLNWRLPGGVWYFRSKEIRITYFEGRGGGHGSTRYKCDVLVK